MRCVSELLESHKPQPSTPMVRAYLNTLAPGKQPATTLGRLKKCALTLLRIDMESYVKKSRGVSKASLSKEQLKALMAVFVQYHSRSGAMLCKRPFCAKAAGRRWHGESSESHVELDLRCRAPHLLLLPLLLLCLIKSMSVDKGQQYRPTVMSSPSANK